LLPKILKYHPAEPLSFLISEKLTTPAWKFARVLTVVPLLAKIGGQGKKAGSKKQSHGAESAHPTLKILFRPSA
jgi:hypothetical protein